MVAGYGLGSSGTIGMPLLGLGSSGTIGIPLLGLGGSGAIGKTLLLEPYEIAAFVAATTISVITRDRNFFAWRDMLDLQGVVFLIHTFDEFGVSRSGRKPVTGFGLNLNSQKI